MEVNNTEIQKSNEYARIAEKLCELGATDKDLAEAFDISVSTLNNWKNDYPDVLEALEKATGVADAKVDKSLYKKAVGYEKDGKHYPPDTAACIFWLTNKQPDQWSDKQQIEHSGSLDIQQLEEVRKRSAERNKLET